MGIVKIKKLLIVATILVSIVSFTGCDSAMQSVELASRKQSSASSQGKEASTSQARKAFTATVNVYQDYESVITVDMGNSNHHKTVQEYLYSNQYGPYGGVIVSDWDLLNGKNVVMSNETNYNLDPLTGEIKGSNHSTIDIVDEYGSVVVTLYANGTLDGSLFGAEINMSMSSKNSDVKVNGKVDGTFVWIGLDYATGETFQILPNGTFTLTGTYK